MTATTRPPEPEADPAEPPLLRFDRVERIAHWVNAALFGIVMLTGSVLYIGELSILVGNRPTVRFLHVYGGLAIPVVFAIALAPRWGRALRKDMTRLNRWIADDRKWLRSFGRADGIRLDKFNAGQKLNAAFVLAATVVMLGTGIIMRWFEPFSLDTRTGATFVHDWFALFIWVSVLGHIWFAFADPESLRAMARGTISARWARRKRARWYEQARPETHGQTRGSEEPAE
jgi:formate dehydrogenase subunit gamma